MPETSSMLVLRNEVQSVRSEEATVYRFEASSMLILWNEIQYVMKKV